MSDIKLHIPDNLTHHEDEQLHAYIGRIERVRYRLADAESRLMEELDSRGS